MTRFWIESRITCKASTKIVFACSRSALQTGLHLLLSVRDEAVGASLASFQWGLSHSHSGKTARFSAGPTGMVTGSRSIVQYPRKF